MVNPLEELFPALARGEYRITSPTDPDYNCIAWAAGDTATWWWPGPDPDREYWPPGVAREPTVAAFRAAFASLGYVACEGEEVEPGFDKIALFANDQGVPRHAARQMSDGRGTSKLGKREDIEHALHDLAGTLYGSVVLVMKRPLPAGAWGVPGGEKANE
jgi:hypothetical protein